MCINNGNITGHTMKFHGKCIKSLIHMTCYLMCNEVKLAYLVEKEYQELTGRPSFWSSNLIQYIRLWKVSWTLASIANDS